MFDTEIVFLVFVSFHPMLSNIRQYSRCYYTRLNHYFIVINYIYANSDVEIKTMAYCYCY
uniref:Uncharacterized protein n=1 Tax=Tetranychus urticae TaxID=32264 RepID=T1KT35_TETUR